jgi:membrane protein DedA with SNARE-associated domain
MGVTLDELMSNGGCSRRPSWGKRMTLLGAFGVLFLTETGVPIPVPGDLVMLLIGERTSAGGMGLVPAMLLLEVVTLIGTSLLFVSVRGPLRAAIKRFGPRVGITQERLHGVAHLLARPTTVAAGRMTPGARTLTVIGAAGAPIPWTRTLPPLLIGSTIFVQAHLLLGYTIGPVARRFIHAATGPMLIVLAVLLVLSIVVWVRKRGSRGAIEAFSEASCPACLAVASLTRRVEA